LFDFRLKLNYYKWVCEALGVNGGTARGPNEIKSRKLQTKRIILWLNIKI